MSRTPVGEVDGQAHGLISVLAWVNRVRAVLGSPALSALPLLGTEADDEARDVVGSTLGVPTGASEHLEWCREERWVMRFDHASTAERVATALGQTWVAEPPEVTLPEALIDLTVSQHFDVVVADEEGWVRGWWLPDDHGFPEFVTPDDLLVPDRGAGSSAA